MATEIPMTGKNSEGVSAIVDDQDADLAQLAWYIYGQPSDRATVNIAMHRMVMQRILGRFPVTGEYVDHINRNPLDNRRENLRICTKSQNHMNREKRKTYRGRKPTSKYKGVHLDRTRNKWMARVVDHGKHVNLGRFDSEIEAAKAYNKAAKEHYGEFAYLNEIEE